MFTILCENRGLISVQSSGLFAGEMAASVPAPAGVGGPEKFEQDEMGWRPMNQIKGKDRVMDRTWILAMGLCGCLAGPVVAADEEEEKPPEGKRGQLTEEQKAVRKEMLEKYDKNKNGKIDEDERKLITAADMEKLARVKLGPAAPRRPRRPETK